MHGAVKKRKQAAKQSPLPEYEAVSDIGDLTDRLIIPNGDYTAQVKERLTRLLPQLTADDANLLAPRHCEYLNARLRLAARDARKRPLDERDFFLAVLAAYSQIGDVRALSDVERIAAGKAVLYRNDAEVRAAAQRCLVHLQRIAALQTQANTLLRGSEPPAAPDTLVRPAFAPAAADADRLLRPASPEDKGNVV